MGSSQNNSKGKREAGSREGATGADFIKDIWTQEMLEAIKFSNYPTEAKTLNPSVNDSGFTISSESSETLGKNMCLGRKWGEQTCIANHLINTVE